MSLVVITIVQVVDMTSQKAVSTLPEIMNGTVIEVSDDCVSVSTKEGNLRLYTSLPLIPGDEITFRPKLIETDIFNLPHTFDLQTYWRNQGIVALVYATEITKTGNHFVLERIAYEARSAISERYDGKLLGYLLMMVLADKSQMDEEVLSSAKSLNISHLFAISGMHVGLLLLFLNTVLEYLPISKRTRSVMITVFLVGYNILTSFSISILRASVQAVCLMFRKQFGVTFSKTDFLSFSMIGFLLFRPTYMFDLGFEMSYGVSFVILFSQQGLSKYQGWMKFFMLQLRIFLFVSLIQIAVSNVVSLTSIFANLLAIEYVTYLLVPILFLTVFVAFISPLASAVITVFEQLLKVLNTFNVSFSFSFVSGFVFFLALAGLTMLFLFSKGHRGRKRGVFLLECSLLLALVFSIKPFMTKVTFFDINQGDAILIQSQGCNLLIDTGPQDDYDGLLQTLRGEGIHIIHQLVLTHQHDDHVGEVHDILSAFEVQTVWSNRLVDDIPQIQVLSVGNTLDCGNAHFLVIHGDIHDTNENNNSIVLLGKIEDETFLLSADIEAKEEVKIMGYLSEVDVVKVPHHGSDTSSTQDFVSALSPETAIISVGKNTYGHPSTEVLNRYEDCDSTVFLTKTDGTISIWYFPLLRLRWIQRFQW